MSLSKLKFLLTSLIILFICLSGVYYKYTCDKNAQRYYRQGIGLYNQKKYSDAYYNFKQIKPLSNMYELSLLKQYQCANNLSDKKTTLLKLREIIKTTKNDTIKPWALYNEAILSQELKTTSENTLAKKFKQIHATYPNTDFGIASAYKSAQLSKENTSQAKVSYINYLSYAPNGKFSLNSIEELDKMNVYFSLSDYETIADANYANEKYQNALKYYEKTIFSKNWYKISKCYRGLKNKEQEKLTIQKGLSLNTSAIKEKDLSQAIERYITLNGGNRIQILQDLYTKYQNSYIFPTVTYKLAESSSSIRSIKLYEHIVNNFPMSIWASNSLWEVFWYNYQQGHYRTCEKLATQHIEEYKDTQDAPRIAYWYGRCLLKSRKNQQARDVFYDVINDYPLSYYSFLSAKQLKGSKAKKMILRKQISSYNFNTLNKYIFKDKLLLSLANLEDWQLIDDFKIDDEYIKSWIAYKKENYPNAINIAKKELFNENEKEDEIEINAEATKEKISFSEQMLKLIYPIKFEQEINEYALKYKQSPYLFLSLIREESHFNKNARSPVGATGLSQLMSSTADFIEKKPVSKETLLTPSENIRIGLRYFSYLVDYFNKDEYLAILAYNAGPGNIKKWLESPNIKSDEMDIFVENIPYIETKNYIKKILSSYWTYVNIYSTKNK